MKLRSRFLPVAIAGALALSACATPEDDADVSAGGVDTEATDTETESETPAVEDEPETDDTETDEPAGDVELAVESGDLGDHLVDAEGNTLYVSTDDEEGASNCGPECANIWQPVEGEATVSGDLDEALLGTVDREDGTTQVTYGDAPLYRFVADQAGDTRGHGVNGTWFVVGPEGEPILEGGLQDQAGDALAKEPTEDATEESTEDEGEDA